jgi:succinoglycan biosynthesis transport protein ExoP
MEKGLGTLLAVLRRRGLPALVTFAAVIGGGFAYLKVTPRMYETSARLVLDDKQVSVSELGRGLSQTGNTLGNSALANQAEVVKSERVLQQALAIASSSQPGNGQPRSVGVTADELNAFLRVKVIPGTNILELSYQSQNPELATRLLNSVAMAVIGDNIKSISSEATKVRQFLELQVPQARNQLQQAEVAENKYRTRSGIVSFDEQTKSLVASLANLQDQERILATQLTEARSRDSSLRQITDTKALDKAYSAVRSGQDDEIKKLRAKLAEQESRLIEARLKLTENHPNVVNLLQQRDSLRSLYSQQLARVAPQNQANSAPDVANDQISQDLTSKLIVNEVESVAIANKLKLVQTERANLQNRLTQLPLQQQPLTALIRKREESVASLKFLQSKLEEARIAEAQKVSTIQVIQAAKTPIEPSSPKPKVIFSLAAAFGTFLATGVILLLEVLDNTLRDGSEAEELLKLPLVGVLPRLSAKTLVLHPAERFLDNVGLVEPYRTLFKTLEFRSPENLRVLVVTSTISGEGKSIVASHLAAVSAMLSRRTLIIDADLRRPIQHTLFNLAPKPGISNVIEGEKSLLNAVQKTDIENLSVLTCGDLHGRPSQLLESAAMKALISEAANHYDFVVIDTPPLSACSDAATLGRYSEGVLMVTRPNFTVKEILQRAVSELTQNHIPIVGVVVNGMTSTTEQYYRYPVKDYQMKRLQKVGSRGES